MILLIVGTNRPGSKIDEGGRLKDAELLQRLKAQAEGFVEFVERLQKVRLRG